MTGDELMQRIWGVAFTIVMASLIYGQIIKKK